MTVGTATNYGEAKKGRGIRSGGVGEGNGKDKGNKTDMDGVGRTGTPRALLLNQKRGTDTEMKHTPDSKDRHPLHHPPSSLPKDPDLFSYILPSHSDTLFARLHSLKEEELLLDYIFPLQGNSFQAHRLVLAAASHTPHAFFGSKLKSGLGVDDVAHRLTPVGLRAALDFAYCGDVTVDLSKEAVMEEVLNACTCLEMERLRQRCTAKVATSAATEREKSLVIIKDMWERGIGCDVTIQAESGERYSGKRRPKKSNNIAFLFKWLK